MIKYLSIGPAGIGIFALSGVIHCIHDRLKNVEEISGTSAGSLLGLCLSLNKEPNEIIDFLFEIDFISNYKLKLKNLKDFGFINFSDYKNIFLNFFKGDPTFIEIPKKLYIGVYNVNLNRTEYFSRDTHPSMSVIDAVMVSMSVPVLFTSKNINDYQYVDGGIFERVPLTPFYGKPMEETLGIQIDEFFSHDKKIKNFKDFSFFIWNNVFNFCSQKHNEKLFQIISINPIENINLLDFKISNDDKLKLFFHGYNTALLHSGLTI